ncbi:kinase [Thraustotheca clavata]|uniref:Kinase n=1 Tax=Thraustotheca clavata TaxID=74557 RepID=A0A1V9ZQJ0_9STRA|nr:kinase [Thraustotheca clavata]
MENQSDESINRKDLSLGQLIGSGSFSKVFAGTYLGEAVAIKRQKKEPKINDYIAREIAILAQIEHPRLLKFIGSCEYKHLDCDEVWIVSEYLKGGDVSKLLKKTKILPPLTWQLKVQIALDAAEALAYLHEQGIIHRDIKSANMLLDEDRRCKLCDFGFAREADVEKSTKPRRRMSLCGTDAYMAPEIYFDEAYDQNADIFSFGVVLIELICHRHVNTDDFIMRNPNQQFRIDIDEFRSATPPDCPQSLSLLAESCVAFEPHDRLNASEIVEWLTDLLADLTKYDECDDNNERSCCPEMLDETEFSVVVQQCFVNEEFEAEEEIDEPPAHSGVLLKRAQHGLRRWRQRYVVIQDSFLTYFPSQKVYEKLMIVDSFVADSDRTIALADCKLKKKSNRRFVLIQGNIRKEFQATSIHELQSWIAVLERAIAVATHTKYQCSEISSTAPSVSDEVYLWLSKLGLEKYATTFIQKGFTTIEFIRETGLAEDDFNFLGIESSKDQAILMDAVNELRHCEI